MENAASTFASFPVMTMPGSPPGLSTELTRRFRLDPECDDFCRSLLARLSDSHDAVATHDDKWKDKYCTILKSFITLLQPRPLLQRIVGGESIASWFRSLNNTLDTIPVRIGLENFAGEDHWLQAWKRGCEEQTRVLARLLTNTNSKVLVGEMNDAHMVQSILITMRINSNIESNKTGRLLELQQRTCD
ncbi:unnamed protein product [Phytophthora lilii]|uniref:Unnamed protein product n=1 Tax=Phytophthora lilii TaxID=2077276 RepID=A0A9W6WR64_9STRA|nr:unnamed protein product [Phytophthora lilii]